LVTVGETLAEARYRAGLTVEELSELTRIRGTVIRSIEHDDYAACGGDLYVRGYVRAIAGAVGLDAQPLIHEYDQARSSAHDQDMTRFDLPSVAADRVPPRYDPPPAPAAQDASTFDLPAFPAARQQEEQRQEPQERAAQEQQGEQEDTMRFDLPRVPADPEPNWFAPTPAHRDPEPAASDVPQVPSADPEPTWLDFTQVTGDPEAATRFDLPTVSRDADATSFDLPMVSRDADATSFDLPMVSRDADATRLDLPQVHQDPQETYEDPQETHEEPQETHQDWRETYQDPQETYQDPPAHQEPAATAYDLPTFRLPDFDAPRAEPGPAADTPVIQARAADFIPGFSGFLGDTSKYSVAEGYVDEPASSMPAVPAEMPPPEAFSTPQAQLPPPPVPEASFREAPAKDAPGQPGPAQRPPAQPSRTPPARTPSAQPWPPPSPARPVRTASSGRTPSTSRLVRQTGSFAALTQTGALRLARTKRWQWATGIVAVIAMVAAGIAGIAFAGGKSSTSSIPGLNAPGAQPQATTSSAAPKPTASAKPTATKTQSVATVPPVAPARTLAIHAAAAFGPSGLADGDNPDLASNAIASHASQAWSTQWYATASFGDLKHGTGLLLDLGRRETVLSVKLYLTAYKGADVQLMAGTGFPASPQSGAMVATAANTGGTLRLTLSQPVTARYLLIWFTQLPPDGQGHYQESVYHVVVTGRH
jgi:cytoskeletal protein RodZ